MKILFVYIMEFFLFKLENKCQYNIILVYLSFTKIYRIISHIHFSLNFVLWVEQQLYTFFSDIFIILLM